jgi:hypothetical protein
MSRATLAAIAERIDSVVSALGYYGTHRAPCQGRHLCSCGLTAALDFGREAAHDLAVYRPDDGYGAVVAASRWQTVAREVADVSPEAAEVFHRAVDAHFADVRP